MHNKEPVTHLESHVTFSALQQNRVWQEHSESAREPRIVLHKSEHQHYIVVVRVLVHQNVTVFDSCV